MALIVGSVTEGKVTGLTKFGAFVELPEGKVGMVHISEVAAAYVKEISDYLEEGQTVKVKILNIDESGKISLSIKKADENLQRREGPRRNDRRGRTPNVWTGQNKAPAPEGELSFEEMMSRFKQVSDEKMSDLKRSSDSRHGGFSRRGGNKQHR